MNRFVCISCLIAVTLIPIFSQEKESPKFEQHPFTHNIANGGAVIWYLGHCGYAVKTEHHFLIFDYQERRDGAQPKIRPSTITLSEGWINPEEIKNLAVRVFVSHSHNDHYDPVILSWQKIVPNIEYYFGWKAAHIPSSHYFIGPRTELTSDNMEISTINSHHSGVPEVAWLVKVDGLVIYHNGDCRPDNIVDEYEFLKRKTDRIDLAFVMPVHEEHERYAKQNTDLFKKFNPRAVFPMHAKAGDKMYADFKKAFESKISGLSVFIPVRMGERFVLRSDGIQKGHVF